MVANVLIAYTFLYAAMLLIPLSIGFAILRRHLWNIDFIINRTLVYGALSACVIGVYVLVVGSFGIALNIQNNGLVSLLAAAIIAVVFQPLRAQLQQGVNRSIQRRSGASGSNWTAPSFPSSSSSSGGGEYKTIDRF